jgi:hypothetical protein
MFTTRLPESLNDSFLLPPSPLRRRKGNLKIEEVDGSPTVLFPATGALYSTCAVLHPKVAAMFPTNKTIPAQLHTVKIIKIKIKC